MLPAIEDEEILLMEKLTKEIDELAGISSFITVNSNNRRIRNDDDEDDDDDDDDDLFVKEDARESIERLISPKKKSNNGNRKREDLLLLHNDDDDDDDLNNELKDERRGDDNKSNRSPSTSIGGSKKALVEKYNALLSRFRALRRDFLKLSSDYDYNYALFAERDKELDELDILLKQEFRKTKRLKERVKSLELEIALTRQA